jgi:uncharacterized protein YyaL (SSP411 family)
VEEVDPVIATPYYPFLDTPNFSGNALAAIALTLLSSVTGRRDFKEAVGRALSALVGKLKHVGPVAAGLAIAVDLHLLEPPRTVVVGVSSDLLEAALHLQTLASARAGSRRGVALPRALYKGHVPRPQAGGLRMRRYGLLDADKTARRSEKSCVGV